MADVQNAPVSSDFWSPKAMTRRGDRQNRTLAVLRLSVPARAALGLRHIMTTAMKHARDGKLPIERRSEEAKIVWGSWDRLADILALPKRPAGGSGRAPRAIDLATILEAHPSEEPCTVDPVTEPAKPAESGPSVASDELPPKQ